jgi:arylsulfatase A-like enzyme
MVMCAALLAMPAAAAPTNFVLMMSDDTGWGDMGYNNGTAQTPHLDAWSEAPSAIRFNRFYAGSPICSPTRASFLTGRTPWRDCIFTVEYRALSVTETHHMSLGEAARSKGYRTAHFGKVRVASSGARSCLPAR